MMPHGRVGIRADGGAQAGLGHLGRCLALAQALKRRGVAAEFVGAPAECRAWIESCGFRTQPWKKERFDLLIADSYRFTKRDFCEMRACARRLCVIEDLPSYAADCDWLLCSRLDAERLSFPARGAQFLLGPRWHPMRREYWRRERARPVRRRIRDLLITLGGGRVGGFASRVASAAAKALPEARLHLVLGPFERGFQNVGRRIRVYRGPTSLRPLIERCDATVSAPGQTLYEMACVGTPAIIITRANNQRPNARSFAAAGAALSIGDARDFSETRLIAALRRLDADPGCRRRISRAGRRLIDGRGALRAAACFLKSFDRHRIRLVPMRRSDIEWIRIQRSRPEMFKYFRQNAPISRAQQAAWWRQLDRTRCRLFIIQEGLRRIGFAGFNSIDWNARSAEFGIFIIPEVQARGYGRQALQLLLEKGFKTLGLRRIGSEVLEYPGENRWQFYQRLGFRKLGDVKVYMKQGKRVKAASFYMPRRLFS